MTAIALRSQNPDDPNELVHKTTDELKAALADCLRVTVDGLRMAAVYVRELESRGEDLAALKVSMMKYLRLIAYGQMLPEVVVRYAGQPLLLNIIGSLPVPDQGRLAAGDSVKMVTYTSDGQLTHRMVDPRELHPAQMRQVFDKGSIRSESEQVVWLDADRAKRRCEVPKAVGELHIDRDRGGVTHCRKFIPLADLVAAVKALRS